MAGTTDYRNRSKRGEPVWELAEIEYPLQGCWTECQFLRRDFKVGVEFVDGCLEFLPMPTEKHQAITKFFFLALNLFVSNYKLGIVHFEGLRVRTRPGAIRLPDVVFLKRENGAKRHNDAWQGADLAFEAVSAGGEERDLETKREEYAAAGISEYWIADFERGTVTVLALKGKKYVEHCTSKRGDVANSKLLPGFAVNVKELFDAE